MPIVLVTVVVVAAAGPLLADSGIAGFKRLLLFARWCGKLIWTRF